MIAHHYEYRIVMSISINFVQLQLPVRLTLSCVEIRSSICVCVEVLRSDLAVTSTTKDKQNEKKEEKTGCHTDADEKVGVVKPFDQTVRAGRFRCREAKEICDPLN